MNRIAHMEVQTVIHLQQEIMRLETQLERKSEIIDELLDVRAALELRLNSARLDDA